MEILSSLNDGGTTVVVITHDAEIARYADRELRIVNGRIARDTPAHAGVVGGGLPS
jgi:ABC-type lipoprotein export system ATPase subunit